MAIPFQKAEFLLSAASPSAFVRDGRKQLAFAGRSNVGKSSVINCLTERKNLARVGASPGKTTQINYFALGERLIWWICLATVMLGCQKGSVTGGGA